MERKTPLYDCHVKYKGKLVEFAGYMLPVQYKTGLMKEHMAVREKCGLFDVLGVELIAIKTAVSTPMVMGSISTLIDGNISNIGSRLREVINITYYINSSFFIR